LNPHESLSGRQILTEIVEQAAYYTQEQSKLRDRFSHRH
jgi:hypothetical protein